MKSPQNNLLLEEALKIDRLFIELGEEPWVYEEVLEALEMGEDPKEVIELAYRILDLHKRTNASEDR